LEKYLSNISPQKIKTARAHGYNIAKEIVGRQMGGKLTVENIEDVASFKIAIPISNIDSQSMGVSKSTAFVAI